MWHVRNCVNVLLFLGIFVIREVSVVSSMVEFPFSFSQLEEGLKAVGLVDFEGQLGARCSWL